MREEEELERESMRKIKQLRKRKHDQKNEDLIEICQRMISENNGRWKLRKRQEEEKGGSEFVDIIEDEDEGTESITTVVDRNLEHWLPFILVGVRLG